MFRSLIALSALAAAGSANAAILFSDTFDSQVTGYPAGGLSNWTIDGNIDVVEGGAYGIACAGKCIDLDGTTGPGGILSDLIHFRAGQAVTVSFDVSGNQRNGDIDSFLATVIFAPANNGVADLISGSPAFTLSSMIDMLNGTPFEENIAGDRGFVTYSYWFTPESDGAFRLGFATRSGDNIGPVLDNVFVSQESLTAVVPEPTTWAMLIAGFGLVGVAARRRRPLAA